MFGMGGRDDGAGFNLVRLTIGASDFSAFGAYSYAPDAGTFDLSHDRVAIVPVLCKSRAAQSGLQLLAAPCSLRAWIKESDQLNGGVITSAAYPALAGYLMRYIRQ